MKKIKNKHPKQEILIKHDDFREKSSNLEQLQVLYWYLFKKWRFISMQVFIINGMYPYEAYQKVKSITKQEYFKHIAK